METKTTSQASVKTQPKSALYIALLSRLDKFPEFLVSLVKQYAQEEFVLFVPGGGGKRTDRLETWLFDPTATTTTTTDNISRVYSTGLDATARSLFPAGATWTRVQVKLPDTVATTLHGETTTTTTTTTTAACAIYEDPATKHIRIDIVGVGLRDPHPSLRNRHRTLSARLASAVIKYKPSDSGGRYRVYHASAGHVVYIGIAVFSAFPMLLLAKLDVDSGKIAPCGSIPLNSWPYESTAMCVAPDSGRLYIVTQRQLHCVAPSSDNRGGGGGTSYSVDPCYLAVSSVYTHSSVLRPIRETLDNVSQYWCAAVPTAYLEHARLALTAEEVDAAYFSSLFADDKDNKDECNDDDTMRGRHYSCAEPHSIVFRARVEAPTRPGFELERWFAYDPATATTRSLLLDPPDPHSLSLSVPSSSGLWFDYSIGRLRIAYSETLYEVHRKARACTLFYSWRKLFSFDYPVKFLTAACRTSQ